MRWNGVNSGCLLMISALRPAGTIPPEFADFNRYDPRLNSLFADQICATPYELQVLKALDAAPGEIVAAQGRCSTYQLSLINPDR